MPRRHFLSMFELAVDAMGFCHCLIPYEKNTPPIKSSLTTPEFSLFRAQRLDRLHARDPTRGQITCRRRRRENAKRCGQISQWIEGADLEKRPRHEPPEA